jgi:hypothetical protein
MSSGGSPDRLDSAHDARGEGVGIAYVYSRLRVFMGACSREGCVLGEASEGWGVCSHYEVMIHCIIIILVPYILH